MVRVLLVEDDKNFSFIIQNSLEQMIGGYEVVTASNGKEGLEKLAQESFDVVVSDIEMPVMDGITMVQQIRQQSSAVAIIFVTGRTQAKDVIQGYHSGADLYLKKPFLPEELDAHIQALIKLKQASASARPAAKETEEAVYTIGSYRFYPEQNKLCHADEQQSLTHKEAQILEILCREKGRVVSRDEILSSVWGTADFYSSRSLDVFLTKLRKYLSQDTRIQIKVLKGVGVCLVDSIC